MEGWGGGRGREGKNALSRSGTDCTKEPEVRKGRWEATGPWDKVHQATKLEKEVWTTWCKA